MVKHPFRLSSDIRKELSYRTGQGIGMYSSWTSMAVTHHLLILLSAYRVGIYPFSDYSVLGDDVVIANKSVASEYQKIVTSIGLDISLTKSIIPTEGYTPVEFASKLILNGNNLSPIPIGLL